MDCREFSKGSPRFDLTALGKEAKESGLWVPEVLFCHLQPPAVMEETESSFPPSCYLLMSAGNICGEVLAR